MDCAVWRLWPRTFKAKFLNTCEPSSGLIAAGYSRGLFPVDRKREQDIAVQLAARAVAGIGEHHAVRDRGACAVNRSTFAGDLIDCIERLRGVEIPNDLSGFGRVGAEMAVQRA